MKVYKVNLVMTCNDVPILDCGGVERYNSSKPKSVEPSPAHTLCSLFLLFTFSLHPPLQCPPGPSLLTPSRVRVFVYDAVTSNLLELLDLIRHGKNHDKALAHANAQDAQAQALAQRNRDKEREQRAQQHEQQQQQKLAQVEAQAQAQQQALGKDIPSPNYQREVEQIVQEEKEAKSKMPMYKGLEKYQLVEKMGEYVRASLAS